MNTHQSSAIKNKFEKTYTTEHSLAKTSARDYTKKYKKQDLAETEADKKTTYTNYIKSGMCKCREKDTGHVIRCQVDNSYMRITRFSSSQI